MDCQLPCSQHAFDSRWISLTLLGSKWVSSDATATETQSGNFLLPLHSILDPQVLQNFLTTPSDEL